MNGAFAVGLALWIADSCLIALAVWYALCTAPDDSTL